MGEHGPVKTKQPAVNGGIIVSFRTIIFAILTVLATLGFSAAAFERGPQGVSPGAAGRLAGIGATCPTFTWESTPGAELYELVVYRVDPAAMSFDSLELTRENEVLFTSISGRATAWTPEARDCFVPGESYLWFIRAVRDVETGEGSMWSEPRFFQVAAAPSAEELERAIEVIRRWEAASGDGSLILSSDAVSAPAPVAVPAAVSDTATVSVAAADSRSGSGSGSSPPKSVITGTAAIRGEQPDFSGETYGVVGLNASPDGAGIGAANIAGGPDLVLHGTVPAELSEVGIDRPSASAQTFSFTNTGGGGMMLDIEGAGVLTTASDLDADTLDGMDSAEFVTDPEAATMFAVHATSADHDGRYFTETELSTSGAGGSVHWDNLAAVPAGFADGIDDDTTYDFGAGLTLDDGQIVIDPTAFHTRISTLDGADDVGEFTSIAIGADGLGLIGYADATNADFKVAHCVDVLCTTATTAVLDSAGSVGPNTSVAIGTDGLGLISYAATSTWDLKVAHCDNAICSSASIATIDSAGSVAAYGTSMTIGADGLGLISYYSGNLKAAHCNDVPCTTATANIVDSSGDVGRFSSIAIGADGLGFISYYDYTNQDLKVAHCSDILCASVTTSTLDSSGDVGWFTTSLAVGGDGLGLISYFDNTNLQLKVAHCNNVTCTSATISTLASILNSLWFDTSIAIGPDGLGLISFWDQSNGDLKVARCNSARCTSATITTVDGFDSVGRNNSIAIGDDNLPLISYLDSTNGDLKVAHLPIGY